MPHDGNYPDSARLRNREQSKHRETPGSKPWRIKCMLHLRAGLGVEDIAILMQCDQKHIRQLVDQLRSDGILPKLYDGARKEWQSVGSIAARLVAQAEAKK